MQGLHPSSLCHLDEAYPLQAKSTGIESGFDECYFFPKRQKPESGRSTSRILDWIVDKTPNPAS